MYFIRLFMIGRFFWTALFPMRVGSGEQSILEPVPVVPEYDLQN